MAKTKLFLILICINLSIFTLCNKEDNNDLLVEGNN